MVSYLSESAVNDQNDFCRSTFYIIIIISILNLSISYVVIHVYLKLKHSKSIEIAEKSLNVNGSIFSFKSLNMIFFVIGGMGVFSFLNNLESFKSKQSSKIPPNIILINFFSVLFPLIFVVRKQDVMAFVKRKIAAKMSFHSKDNICPPSRPKHIPKLAWT